jgi:plasmid replication initiation protein
MFEAISNTPLVFGYITNPTPRMQRALLAMLEERMRNNRGRATELAALLVTAYDSPHITEVIPGLRAAVAATRHEELPERARNVMAFLGAMQSPFDVIELN